MTSRSVIPTLIIFTLVLSVIGIGGCTNDKEESTSSTGAKTTFTPTTATATTPVEKPVPVGIQIDPALKSATGIPTPEEMPALIALQAKLPYPLIVPTFVPGGYQLDTTLMGYSGPGGTDPVGYYSFRYYHPEQDILNMTFNQSLANSKPLSGYYLTDAEINGQPYQVYWHKTREYLPDGDPVRMDSVGDAEAFVVVWQGQYTDAAGVVHTINYGITTSTYTGIDWGSMQEIISSLKPLSAVGG
jgi:hypothetical protein